MAEIKFQIDFIETPIVMLKIMLIIVMENSESLIFSAADCKPISVSIKISTQDPYLRVFH